MRPASSNRPAAHVAVGVISIFRFSGCLGSGMVTSTTPSEVFALIFLASTPAGSAIERLSDP